MGIGSEPRRRVQALMACRARQTITSSSAIRTVFASRCRLSIGAPDRRARRAVAFTASCSTQVAISGSARITGHSERMGFLGWRDVSDYRDGDNPLDDLLRPEDDTREPPKVVQLTA